MGKQFIILVCVFLLFLSLTGCMPVTYIEVDDTIPSSASITSSPRRESSVTSAPETSVTSEPSSEASSPAASSQEPVIPPPPVETVPKLSAQDFSINDIFNEINAYRAQAGLGGVSYDGELTNLAYTRAWEITATGSHLRPDGSDYTTIFPDGWTCCGEVLLRTTEALSPQDMVIMWSCSPDANSTLLNAALTRAGIAVIVTDGGVAYIAVLFLD